MGTHKDVGVGECPDVTLLPIDTGEQMLQFGVDFEDRLERQTGVAVLVVIERVDLVMPHESADRESILFVVVIVQVSSFIVREAEFAEVGCRHKRGVSRGGYRASPQQDGPRILPTMSCAIPHSFEYCRRAYRVSDSTLTREGRAVGVDVKVACARLPAAPGSNEQSQRELSTVLALHRLTRQLSMSKKTIRLPSGLGGAFVRGVPSGNVHSAA